MIGDILSWVGLPGLVVAIVAAGVALRFAFPGAAETVFGMLRPVGEAIGKAFAGFILVCKEGGRHTVKSGSAMLFVFTLCCVAVGVTAIIVAPKVAQKTEERVWKDIRKRYTLHNKKPVKALSVRDYLPRQLLP